MWVCVSLWIACVCLCVLSVCPCSLLFACVVPTCVYLWGGLCACVSLHVSLCGWVCARGVCARGCGVSSRSEAPESRPRSGSDSPQRGHPGARPAGRSAWRVRQPHTWARRRLSRSHPLRPPPRRAGISGGADAAPCLCGAGSAQLSGPSPPQTRTALGDATAALVAPVTASRTRPRLPRRPRVGQPRVPASPRPRVRARRGLPRPCARVRACLCVHWCARAPLPSSSPEPTWTCQLRVPVPVREQSSWQHLQRQRGAVLPALVETGGEQSLSGARVTFLGDPHVCVCGGPGSAELVPWLPGQWAPGSRPPFTPPQWFV